ncbi:nuclease [Aspergillus arachidicola]|uniref:Endonuclease n=1 Tax=Aspergillus arachidicola TaxID=656916 RepID=A0A2G7G868_9EURO|nr:nuclease [Aspergillus arachidicola]
MSKATFAAIAAASAAPELQQQQQQQQKLPPSAPVTSTTPAPTHPAAPSLATKSLAGPVDPSGIYQYGFPGPVADTLLSAPLAGAYDRRTRNPAWVAEHITPASLAMKNADRKHSTFYEDTTIPAAFRAKLNDYFRSGYDRGHQVPAADAKWSQEAMDATFALTNMCPQVGEGFNRDYWAHFEEFCRGLAKKYPSVRVVTGPLYLPQRDADGKWRVSYEVIGNPPNVAVPTHFYKRLTEFEVPVEVVERASGLEFVSKLEANRRKRLCQEIKCDVVVREFNNSAKRN